MFVNYSVKSFITFGPEGNLKFEFNFGFGKQELFYTDQVLLYNYLIILFSFYLYYLIFLLFIGYNNY
jgi:hypothetical protein